MATPKKIDQAEPKITTSTVPRLPTKTGIYRRTDGMYDSFTVQVYIVRDEHVLQIPVAGPPGTPCKIVRTAAPTAQKIVTWIAEKMSNPPDGPDPTPRAGETLLHHSIMDVSKVVIGDKMKYTVSGITVYALDVPPDLKSVPEAGLPPFVIPTALAGVIRGNRWYKLPG